MVCQKEEDEKDVEEEEEEEKKKGRMQGKKWLKCRELCQGFFAKKTEKNIEKKVSGRKRKQPKVRRTLAKCGKRLFLSLMVAQSWLGASAAFEEAQGRSGPVTRKWQEMEVKESSWEEAFPKMRRRKGGQDRTEMQKEARRVRCTLLGGSAWSTERKHMRRYAKVHLIFSLE